MIRRTIGFVMATFLLAMPVHAAVPDEVQSDGTVISVTDITPGNADMELPENLPVDIQMRTEDGVKLLVKTFEVAADVQPQDLAEQNLVRNGTEYRLRDVLRETLPGSSQQQTASQIVSVSSESDKETDILPLLPEYVDYSENGFVGRLLLDVSTLKTEVESTSGYTYTISDSKDFTGLDRNDPYLIPKTSSKNGIALTLADIQWTPGTAGNEQRPTYSATATYTGKASGSKPNGYLVTARYSGTVEKAIPGNVRYSLVYEAVPAPIIPETFDWGKIGVISLYVIGCGVLLVLGVFAVRKLGRMPRRKKAAVSGYEEYMEELETRPERRKPHALGYMRRDNLDA